MADIHGDPMSGGNPADPGAQAPLEVNVPDELKRGTYANAVSVNVNSNETVVDFGYLLPNTPNPIIEVVARVNMNHKTAESFLNVLSGAMEDFKKKQASQGATGAPAAPAAPHPAPAAPAAPVAPVAPHTPPPAPAPHPAPGAPLPNNL